MLFGTYQNSACVVCGKHQNPWREVNIPVAREESIPVLRRITGGGTVYHDPGNLVFTFAMSRNLLERSQNLRVIKTALAACGVAAELTDGFDLYAKGSKISGSAFRFRRNRGIHHGTLLVDADRPLMSRILRSTDSAIVTYAVQSRPASTINLAELGAICTIEEIKANIERAVIEYFRPASVERGQVPTNIEKQADEIVTRLRSWEWTYGNTPPFEITLGAAAETLRLRIKKGRVESVLSSSDETARVLVGCRFVKDEMIERNIGAWARRIVEQSTLL